MSFSRVPLIISLVGLAGIPAASNAATALGVVQTYDGTPAGPALNNAPGNAQSASAFTTAVAGAFTGNTGGVINFGTSASADAQQLNITYGGAKTFSVTSTLGFGSGATGTSQLIDIRANLTTITPISGTTALLPNQQNGIQSWTFNFSGITGGAIGEAITTTGFTLLSRSGTSQDATVEWFLNGSATAAASQTDTFDNSNGGDNTFFSYTAPAGSAITGFRITYLGATGTNDRRLGIDDLGFITGVIPEPSSMMLLGLGALSCLSRRRRTAA